MDGQPDLPVQEGREEEAANIIAVRPPSCDSDLRTDKDIDLFIVGVRQGYTGDSCFTRQEFQIVRRMDVCWISGRRGCGRGVWPVDLIYIFLAIQGSVPFLWPEMRAVLGQFPRMPEWGSTDSPASSLSLRSLCAPPRLDSRPHLAMAPPHSPATRLGQVTGHLTAQPRPKVLANSFRPKLPAGLPPSYTPLNPLSFLLKAASIRPDHPALLHPAKSLSYTFSEWATRVSYLAYALRSRGIKAGDRVLVCAPNVPMTADALQAICALQAIIVPVRLSLVYPALHR
jgi:hypothetical protein